MAATISLQLGPAGESIAIADKDECRNGYRCGCVLAMWIWAPEPMSQSAASATAFAANRDRS
jgi:hypothetical protein